MVSFFHESHSKDIKLTMFEKSAGLVRDLFRRSIELGRRYGRDGNKADKYEALRLMGTGLHCLEGKSELSI